MPRPWFEERPHLLETELKALEEAGVEVEVRQPDREEGRIVLDLAYPVDRLDLDPPPVDEAYLRLTARYPDSFPYFRPEVETDHVDLPRHHGPDGGNLCLLGRATINWDSNDSLAQLLEDQLASVLREGRVTEPGVLAEREGEQAEPFTDYYSYVAGSSLLIDPPEDLSVLTDAATGRLLLGFQGQPSIVLRGAVIEIRDNERNPLAALSDDIAAPYSNRIGARWVRLDDPVSRQDPIADLQDRVPEALRPPQEWQPVENGWIDVIGVVFPDETSTPGQKDDGWVFVVRFRRQGRRRTETRAYFAPAMRVGEEHRFARIPELAPLRNRSISVVGLGCLGAPSALEFARAGVGELRVVDHDSVDAATSVRWPMGFAVAGMPKVQVIEQFVSAHYPYCDVQPFVHKVGTTNPGANLSDSEVVDALLEGSNLLYDASAEWGVQHYLSQCAREAGVPYVAVGGRQGGWGGVIVRDVPDSPGCWGCYQRHMADGVINTPPADPAGAVQPAGCADPTFTAAGFDLQQNAMMGVRLAVATLSRGEENGYPDMPWDVGVLSLRDADGTPCEPRWETFPLEPHPDCSACQ